MVRIPVEYKKDCEPESSRYGRFLRSYYIKKQTKYSKIEKLLQSTASATTLFGTMSKLEFLNNFLLNDAYTIDDFLHVKSASLRGYLFECIWDICIKCNVIPELSNKVAHHMYGRIEELRETSEQMRRKLRSFHIIEDIYGYLKNNKVVSGSTGGVSDITLMYYGDARRYILISSKFYNHEKNIESYDVAKLQHAMKDTDTCFDIVLLVHDKNALDRKIAHSKRQDTKQFMKWKYDKDDLKIYVHRLRTLFWQLDNIRSVLPRAREAKMIRTFFKHNSRHWKPIVEPHFHTYMFYNVTHGTGNRITLWNSSMPGVIFDTMLFYISKHLGNTYAIVCNEEYELTLKKNMNEYFEFSYAKIEFCRRYSTKIHVDTTFTFGTIDDLHNLKLLDGMGYVIFICMDVLKHLPDHIPGISWNMETILALQSMDHPWIYWFRPFCIEQSLVNLLGHDVTEKVAFPIIPKRTLSYLVGYYKSFGDFVILTDRGKKYGDLKRSYKNEINSLKNVLFGSRNDHLEEYVFWNRIRKFQPQDSEIVWIVPQDMIQTTHEVVRNDTFMKSQLQGSTLHIHSMNTMNNIVPNVVIVSDPRVGFEDLYHYLQHVFEQRHLKTNRSTSNNTLILIELHAPRAELFQMRFSEDFSLHVMDPDV